MKLTKESPPEDSSRKRIVLVSWVVDNKFVYTDIGMKFKNKFQLSPINEVKMILMLKL